MILYMYLYIFILQQQFEGIERAMLEQKMMQLNQAFRDQNKEKIIQILQLPQAQKIIQMVDESKYTPLFWACSSLSQNIALQIIPKMLAKGADPLRIDSYFQNVLYYIAKTGKQQLMRYLLDRYKFDLNTNDNIKQTPLFFAVFHNKMGCTKLLLERGADINHTDANGQNCLFWAASGGHLQMCKYLVNNGVNFSKIDGNKETAINYAKKSKHTQIVNYLTQLKQNSKRNKQVVKMESSQPEDKGQRKKKQLMQQKYCLIYTNQKGEVHQLTFEQLQKFKQTNQLNRSIVDLIYNPNKLDNQALPEQKKYEKVVNKILTHFMKHEQGPIFLYPVDYITLNIPHYPNVIKHPMDFTTIKTKLTYNAYDSEQDFNADMNLVFDNCIRFNGVQSSYGKVATQMKLEFNTMYKKQFGI